jgi:hypothetical protein
VSDIDQLMQRGADAYAAGDFATAQEAWQAAADAGHDGAHDALRLLAHGDTRRQVLWGRMAERDNAGALWSLGVAAVERADLPGVRDSWSQAAALDEALAGELAGLLECEPAAAAETLLALDDGPLAYRLGELCFGTGRESTALVWWNLAVAAGSPEAEALLERLGSDQT